MPLIECPHCHASFRPAPATKGVGRRNCAKCKRNIGKREKWYFNEQGQAQHRHCDNPESYHAKGTA